ncbi:MAG: hypothetical protein WCK67_09105 [bacterium]
MNSINSSNYNHQISFSAAKPDKTEKKNTAIAAVKMEDVRDSAELSNKKAEKKEKKGGFNPIQGFKNFMSGCKKLWIGTCEYTKATVIGGAKGAVLGGIVGGIAHVMAVTLQKTEESGLKKFANNKNLTNGFQKFGQGVLNHLPKSTKGQVWLGVLVGSLPLIGQLYEASLNVSEKTAQVDHRYNTGHRKED